LAVDVSTCTPRSLLLVLLLVACGSAEKDPEPQVIFTDGARLKAVYLETEGAPRRFLNWYDTELESDCTFADMGLDQPVCFPTSRAGTGLTNFFSPDDSGCKTPKTRDATYVCGPIFSARVPQQGEACGTLVHLSHLASEPAVPGADTLGLCQGPDIPLEGLVSGTYRPGTGPGRIVPLTIVASDGAVQGIGSKGWFQGDTSGEIYPQVISEQVAWDTERSEMVSASHWDQVVEKRWRPLVQQDGHFADPECSSPAVFASACPVRAKAAFSFGPADSCGHAEPTAFFELGAPGAVGAVGYASDPVSGACSPDGGGVGSDPMRAAFSLGAQIPAAAFASAVEARTGAKQLQLIQAGSADGGPAYPLGFFDRVHGLPCENQQAADDSERCLPTAGLVWWDDSLFADAACTIPLSRVPEAGECGPAPVLIERRERVEQPDPCSLGMRAHFFSISEPHLGPSYLKLGNGPCELSEDTGAAADGYHLVGPELPPSDFAPLRLVRP
jgi:hypothetical protein